MYTIKKPRHSTKQRGFPFHVTMGSSPSLYRTTTIFRVATKSPDVSV